METFSALTFSGKQQKQRWQQKEEQESCWLPQFGFRAYGIKAAHPNGLRLWWLS